MSLARKTADSLSLTAASQGIQFVLQVASASILGRKLLPADYGAFAMATSVMGLAAMFRDFGMSQAAIRRESVTGDEYARLFWLSTGISVLCGLVLLGAAPFSAGIFQNDRLPPVVLALVIPTVLTGLATLPNIRLSREHRFKELAGFNLLAASMGLVTAIVMALLGCGIWSLVGQLYATAIVSVIGVWSVAPVPLRAGAAVDVWPILRHGAWLACSEVIWLGEENLRRGVLGWLLGETAMGEMQRPKDVIDIPIRIFNSSATSVSLPLLSSVQSDPDRFKRGIIQIGAACELLLTIPIAILIACSQDGLLLLLGPRWHGAARYCFWLSLLSLGSGGLQTLHWILVLSGQGRRQVALQACSSASMFVPAIAGGLVNGALGAAIGMVAGYFLASAIRLWLVLPLSGIARHAWLLAHGPLWILQIGGGVAGHLAARACGAHGSLSALAGGAAAALLGSGGVLLAVPSYRTRLREHAGLLLRRRGK